MKYDQVGQVRHGISTLLLIHVKQSLIFENRVLLKTGSHVLQRIPQMVTQINDRQVTSLSSGGEYNVAVDSDSQVWVWGRNEFGQVCSPNI